MCVGREARCKRYRILKKWFPHVIWKCLLVYEPALQPGEWGDGSRKCCLSRSWLPGIARKIYNSRMGLIERIWLLKMHYLLEGNGGRERTRE